MNCWHCGPDVQLIWGGDFNGEDYCNDEIAIVSNLSCPKCDHTLRSIYQKMNLDHNV